MIQFSCSTCSYSIKAPDCAVGEELHCPSCRNLLFCLDEYPARMKKLKQGASRNRRHLRLIRLLQTVRRPFSFFGKGPLERLGAALICYVPFFFLAFWLCLPKLSSTGAIAVSALIVFFLMTITAMVVLGKTDAELEEERAELQKELPKLEDRIIDLKQRWHERYQEAQELAQKAREAEQKALLAAEEARRTQEEARRRKLLQPTNRKSTRIPTWLEEAEKPNSARRFKMKRWAILTVLLYATIVLLLAGPAVSICLAGINGMNLNVLEYWRFFQSWVFSMWFTVLIIGQVLLLLVPIDISERRLTPRRQLKLPVIVTAFFLEAATHRRAVRPVQRAFMVCPKQVPRRNGVATHFRRRADVIYGPRILGRQVLVRRPH